MSDFSRYTTTLSVILIFVVFLRVILGFSNTQQVRPERYFAKAAYLGKAMIFVPCS